MDKAQSMIQVYRTCFYICMAITVLGLANAVFLFFRFDIRTIFEIRTGRAAKRTIRRMEEANASTGRLRQEDMDFTTGGLTTGGSTTAPLFPPKSPASGSEETTLLNAAPPPAPAAPAAPVPQPAAPGFRFVVTQAVVFTHTSENI